MMKRPILFSGEMVKAILAGSKTQTRRPVKSQPPPTHTDWWWISGDTVSWQDMKKPFENVHDVRCPYGQPDDRLWVRETWLYAEDQNKNPMIAYRAANEHRADLKWRSSIFMPHYASRITLKIADIRIERVQDISEADAIAEGITKCKDGSFFSHVQGFINHETAKSAFAELWDSIYDERGGGWGKNPWVWVIEFRRIIL